MKKIKSFIYLGTLAVASTAVVASTISCDLVTPKTGDVNATKLEEVATNLIGSNLLVSETQKNSLATDLVTLINAETNKTKATLETFVNQSSALSTILNGVNVSSYLASLSQVNNQNEVKVELTLSIPGSTAIKNVTIVIKGLDNAATNALLKNSEDIKKWYASLNITEINQELISNKDLKLNKAEIGKIFQVTEAKFKNKDNDDVIELLGSKSSDGFYTEAQLKMISNEIPKTPTGFSFKFKFVENTFVDGFWDVAIILTKDNKSFDEDGKEFTSTTFFNGKQVTLRGFEVDEDEEVLDFISELNEFLESSESKKQTRKELEKLLKDAKEAYKRALLIATRSAAMSTLLSVIGGILEGDNLLQIAIDAGKVAAAVFATVGAIELSLATFDTVSQGVNVAQRALERKSLINNAFTKIAVATLDFGFDTNNNDPTFESILVKNATSEFKKYLKTRDDKKYDDSSEDSRNGLFSVLTKTANPYFDKLADKAMNHPEFGSKFNKILGFGKKITSKVNSKSKNEIVQKWYASLGVDLEVDGTKTKADKLFEVTNDFKDKTSDEVKKLLGNLKDDGFYDNKQLAKMISNLPIVPSGFEVKFKFVEDSFLEGSWDIKVVLTKDGRHFGENGTELAVGKIYKGKTIIATGFKDESDDDEVGDFIEELDDFSKSQDQKFSELEKLLSDAKKAHKRAILIAVREAAKAAASQAIKTGAIALIAGKTPSQIAIEVAKESAKVALSVGASVYALETVVETTRLALAVGQDLIPDSQKIAIKGIIDSTLGSITIAAFGAASEQILDGSSLTTVATSAAASALQEWLKIRKAEKMASSTNSENPDGSTKKKNSFLSKVKAISSAVGTAALNQAASGASVGGIATAGIGAGINQANNKTK